MARAPKPDSTIRFEYEGEDYALVYDMAAIAFFEREADVSIVDALEGLERAQKLGKQPKLSHLGYLVCAGLNAHHPEVTLEEAMQMLGDEGVMAALGASMAESMPKARDGGSVGNAPVPARKRGTGTSSKRKRSKAA